MESVYDVLLQRGHIERWKTEGYYVEISDHKNNFRDPESRNLQHTFTVEENEDLRDECRRYGNIQDDYKRDGHRNYRCSDHDESIMNQREPYFADDNFETNQYQNNYNTRQNAHRREESEYGRDSDYFDDDVYYEDRYNYQNASNQSKMYESYSPNYYYETNDQQSQILNYQQREYFDERIRDHNEFDNQNRNRDSEEHWQNMNMTSQDYERNNFNNRDQYFEDYNTNSRNNSYTNDDRSYYLSERERKYSEQQEIYRRLCNRQLPSFNNDCYRRDYFIHKRKFNRERVDDFIIPPVIFSDSQPNRNLEKDKEQWDHNISPSISELRLATESEESSDKITTHSIKKTVEEEQITVYTNPIINNSDDKEDINISEELPEEEMIKFWDSEMFEDDKGNKEDTLQNPDPERSNFTMELEEEDQFENNTCPINEVLQPKNDISKSKGNHKLNETILDKKINEKIIEKSEELLYINQVNIENVSFIDNSHSIVEHMNSGSPTTNLKKGKPPGKIKSITQEQLSIKNEEGSKEEELSVQISNADEIISTNTYVKVEEFIINKIPPSGKSLNQEILEMIKYYISVHNKLSGTHQKYFWDIFLLGINKKNEIIYRFEENKLLQCKVPKIVVTKIPFNRLGIG